MKSKIGLFFVGLFCWCSLANALSLFDFTVFVSESLEASHGDYHGLVGAGKNAKLSHFLVNASKATAGKYSVLVGESLEVNRTSIVNYNSEGADQAWISAPILKTHLSGDIGENIISEFPVESLESEMHQKSQTFLHWKQVGQKSWKSGVLTLSLASGQVGLGVVNVTAEDLESSHRVNLHASQGQFLVVNILGSEAWITSKSFKLTGGIEHGRLIFNFPDATSVEVHSSGYYGDLDLRVRQRRGIPGTLLAPNALVRFNNGLITGAIYSKNLESNSNGQINYGPPEDKKLKGI